MKYIMKIFRSQCHNKFYQYIPKAFYHNVQSGEENNLKAHTIVNLRSDTFTKPNIGMRNAMRDASVGDDVWQEDQTVLELENKLAQIAGKETGLYVPSGTMGNLLCILAHCSRRGAEVLLGNESHVFHYEQANIVQFGGVQPYTIPTKPDGTFCLHHLEAGIRDYDFHCPSTELICIENTHGNLGGIIIPLKWLDEVVLFAKVKRLPLHLDGARIFNASVASGIPVARLLKGVNSASICLSKGLGAPVGTVIVGDHEFIEKARRLRKGLGGGWRQAGILAAAGLYAVNHNVDRLSEDHASAKFLANGINEMKSYNFHVDMEGVHTNMVMIKVNKNVISAEKFCDKLTKVSEDEGNTLGKTVSVLASSFSDVTVRLVTHLDVSQQDAESALSKLQYVIRSVDEKQ